MNTAHLVIPAPSCWTLNLRTSCFVEKALKLAQPDVDMLILEQQLQDPGLNVYYWSCVHVEQNVNVVGSLNKVTVCMFFGSYI